MRICGPHLKTRQLESMRRISGEKSKLMVTSKKQDTSKDQQDIHIEVFTLEDVASRLVWNVPFTESVVLQLSLHLHLCAPESPARDSYGLPYTRFLLPLLCIRNNVLFIGFTGSTFGSTF